MTFLETILDELRKIFKKDGINTYTDEELISKLDIRISTFKELFPSKVELVNSVIKYDNQTKKAEHEQLLATARNSVDKIFMLLKDGINDLQVTSPQYVHDLQHHYPQAWAIGVEHLNTYSYHQLYDIINTGILEGHFRKDINIQLVVKIILEQIFLILNPVSFPPDKYELSEVFRSIYLYYIRGLCTDKGGKLAEEFFTKD